MKKNNSRLLLLKGFIGFSVSSWVGAALSFISTPIITRAFSTEELGKINLFIAIVNMFLNFIYLGIDQAFTRFYYEPPGRNDQKSFLGVCLSLTTGVTILVAAGIVLFYKDLSSMIIGYITFTIPLAIILSIVANIVLRFFNLAARMKKNILLFNIQTIVITAISNISYVLVAIDTASAEKAIVFRTVLLLSAATVFLLYASKKALSFNMDLSKSVIKEIFVYALPVCPAAILSVANTTVGQVFMKCFVDYSAVGIYSNATTVASIITIIQQGINNYWGPYVYENYKSKQTQIIKMHHMISFIMLAFGLGIILFQDLIYTLLVGKNFWASKQLFPLLIISPICYTISETLGMGIRLSKKTFLNIPVYVLNIVVNLSLCFLLLPRIGVIGAAFASAVSSVVMLIAKSIFGERLYRCSDNYLKLIIGLSVLVITAIIHIFVYESMVKYIVYFVAIAIICVIYFREINSALNLLKDLKEKIIKTT